MSINITNKEVDRLVRRLAKIEGTSLTQAVILALREALSRRHAETPLQTAARLRAEFGVRLTERSRRPLSRAVYDEMSGESGPHRPVSKLAAEPVPNPAASSPRRA